MKFIISTQELNHLLNKILNVIPLKSTIPILSNFLIEANYDQLILTATDLTVGIRCYTEAKILQEGATTLPAKKFAQLVRELTAPTVEVTSKSNDIITLIAGTSRFKIIGTKKEEFPSLPDLSHALSFQIKQSILKQLLYCTSFAVSKEDNRYVLTGVLMHIAQGQLTFVGTDGKRLGRAYAPIEIAATVDSQSIIPLKAVDEILKNLSDEGEAKISIMPDKMAIEANQILLLTKLLVGDYPDVNRVIPEHSDVRISVHREELMALLRQVSLFTADHYHSARFTFTNGELKLTANEKKLGEGDVGMPINYQGPKFEIAFNPLFFIDILRHCHEESVTLGLTDPYNPVIITDGYQPLQSTQTSPLFVIMPMRLSEDPA